LFILTLEGPAFLTIFPDPRVCRSCVSTNKALLFL
jgi:hypothetical protein